MKSHEFTKPQYADDIEKFVKWVCTKLHINMDMPNIIYSDEKEQENQHRTGWYNPETNHLWVYTGKRNLVDIMRTLAHELSHHKQKLDGDTTHNNATSDIETQADEAAGMLIKIYVRAHPEIIE